MQEPRIISEYPLGQFYTLSYIASKCGISRSHACHCVRDWGIIPPADFRDRCHRYLYTLPQVEAIVLTWRRFKELGHGRIGDPQALKAAILEAWPK